MEEVAEERRAGKRRAELEKARELEVQFVQLREEREKALEEQRRELTEEMDRRLAVAGKECEEKCSILREQCEAEAAATRGVQEELVKMTELKTDWEERYTRLRAEFTDFIDKIPGFNAEYLLK